MNDDEWIPIATALAILGDGAVEWARLSWALMLGQVRSQGVKAEDQDPEPVEIDRAYWGEWPFDPKRGWLNRPGHERRRVPTGFVEVRCSRADVEELAKGGSIRRAQKTVRRPSLVDRLVTEMRTMFPNGRPPMSNKELEKEIRLRAGVGEFKERTLQSAIRRAWPRIRQRTK